MTKSLFFSAAAVALSCIFALDASGEDKKYTEYDLRDDPWSPSVHKLIDGNFFIFPMSRQNLDVNPYTLFLIEDFLARNKNKSDAEKWPVKSDIPDLDMV